MAHPSFAAVLFADVVGSTETIARLGERAGETWRQGALALLRGQLAATQGREVQHTGDGLFAVFTGASRAAAASASTSGRCRCTSRVAETSPIYWGGRLSHRELARLELTGGTDRHVDKGRYEPWVISRGVETRGPPLTQDPQRAGHPRS